jgi:hypothetical protein
MTTFNWNCRTVDVYPTDETYADVVYNVHWIVTGTSDQLDPQDNPVRTQPLTLEHKP